MRPQKQEMQYPMLTWGHLETEKKHNHKSIIQMHQARLLADQPLNNQTISGVRQRPLLTRDRSLCRIRLEIYKAAKKDHPINSVRGSCKYWNRLEQERALRVVLALWSSWIRVLCDTSTRFSPELRMPRLPSVPVGA